MKRIIALILAVLALWAVTGCVSSSRPKDSIKITEVYFDTVITIEIWGTKDTSILEKCKEICAKYEQLFSSTISTSDVSQINNAKGAPVKVNPETAKLVQKGLDYSQLSGGTFDITIAPLSTLWDVKQNPGNIPSQEAIDEAKSHVNYKNVIVEGSTVTLTDPKAAIDLGGIAKGYIADKLKEYLSSKGVKHGLINLGGNIVSLGGKPEGGAFRIGIQKPFDEKNQAITSVDMRDESVVSSGIYERYFKKDGKIYHHLLEPVTGYPYDNNLLQVTIISEKSVDADALSTAAFGLGLEKGSALIKGQKDVKAIFVTDDYRLHYVNN